MATCLYAKSITMTRTLLYIARGGHYGLAIYVKRVTVTWTTLNEVKVGHCMVDVALEKPL